MLGFEHDAALDFTRITRPRTVREVSLSLLSEVAKASETKLYLVKRDPRGLAPTCTRGVSRVARTRSTM